MLAALDNDEVEFGVHDADAREGVLLGTHTDLEAVPAVGQAVDLEDEDVYTLGGILLLVCYGLLLALLLGELAIIVRVDMSLVSFSNLAVDTGFDSGRVLDSN